LEKLKKNRQEDEEEEKKLEGEPQQLSVPTPEEEKTEETPTRVADTIAGVREYNTFFGLYAKYVKLVREEEAFLLFLSLGYIPGPAVILEVREDGEVRILETTPNLVRELGTVPAAWMARDKLPERIRQAWAEWKDCVNKLGYKPSPYNLGLANDLLRGRFPRKHLTMYMRKFYYGSDDSPKQFGVTLIPLWEGEEFKGFKLETHNPDNIPNVPADDTVLQFEDLEKEGPVQKMLNTHGGNKGMEKNYSDRYDRDGNRRQQSQPRPQPRSANQQRSQYKRPTW